MKFKNGESHRVSFQYIHKDYDHWSAPMVFEPGGDALLSRAHYFEDVRGLRVLDGQRVYEVNKTQLAAFHVVCDGASFCTIFYEGGGRIRVSRS